MAKQTKSVSKLALTSAIVLGIITLLFATCGVHGSIQGEGEEQKLLIAVWAFIPAIAFSIYPFRILSKWIKERRK